MKWISRSNAKAFRVVKYHIMAVLRFRIYWEEDDAVYRDIAILHKQNFRELHEMVLNAFEFDSKHQATFFRSNDHWQRGREISLEQYDKVYKAEPLLMEATQVGSEIREPNQKFVYLYDFNKNWTFFVELINVSKEENPKIAYPSILRSEGIAPSQYGTRGLVGDKLTEMEEKYDLSAGAEGFGEEGEEEGGDDFSEEAQGTDEDTDVF